MKEHENALIHEISAGALCLNIKMATALAGTGHQKNALAKSDIYGGLFEHLAQELTVL